MNNGEQFFNTAGGGYAIERSLRFNSSDSAYLSRTPASSGNRKTWTFACWLKKGKNSISQSIFSNSTATEAFKFDSDTLYFYSDTGSNGLMTTNAVLRDPSAWYHVLLSVDTTQATAANRANIYINGVLQTLNLDTRPTQNYDTLLNSATALQIGGPTYLDAYLADIHFIDGQALDPTSFGEFDDNGIWQPKAFAGSYGTNGFHLDFADNASTTTIGYDAAGSNDWTSNNLSVTAGAGNDSLVDVPTNGAQTDTGAGGEVRGNYCTLNPLDKSASVPLSNGNLDIVGTTTNALARSTIFVSSGKWYYECTITTSYSGNPIVGWARISAGLGYLGGDVNGWGYAGNAMKYNGGLSDGAYGASYGVGDVVGVALDLDAGTLVFYKNGVSQGTAFSNVSGTICPATSSGASTTQQFNFGQRPFAHPLTGFKALNTANLPAPVVTKPSTVFDTKLYTGNGSTQTISGLGFSPDFVWIKSRSQSNRAHRLYDIIRGPLNSLASSDTGAEQNVANTLSAFNSDGFSLGSDVSENNSGSTYVAWTWDAGTTTTTNTVGSISSQVRANASAGFSVQTWTASGSGTDSWGHGLGVAPEFVIVKRRSSAQAWYVWHKALTFSQYLFLNSTSSVSSYTNIWGASGPSSSLVSFSASPGDHVSYTFAPVSGYSSFGSYTGNSSADGPFVYTGFRPRWILIKQATSSGDGWHIYDAQRIGYNPTNLYLWANGSNEEQTSGNFDLLSNGFKLRTTASALNYTGYTYIYFAVAESPFQYARAR